MAGTEAGPTFLVVISAKQMAFVGRGSVPDGFD